jgi:hypothetical protein
MLLGPVWVYTRYPTTKHMLYVDAPCVHECGGPTHDERRRAIKSHEWRLSDAARACVPSVWVYKYTRYPTTKHMSYVDAPCVHECGGPTHDERRRAIKSHEWRLSDATTCRACVQACSFGTY